MKRRAFFQLGWDKTMETVVDLAETSAQQHATHWFRPPFAVGELHFLLGCTRCDRCMEACPPGIVFTLPARLGPKVVGTPAMDLLNRGCLMCADWPCVAACEPGVLRKPVVRDAGVVLPKLSRVWIDSAHCLPFSGPECGACGSVCPVVGAMKWSGVLPLIVEDLCTGCALCRAVCPTKAIRVSTSILPKPEEK